MEKEILAHIENIYKHFGITKAVDGVSVDLYKGEICGLVGENGSGKSTLLSLMSGLLHPDSGSIVLEGKSYAPQNQTQANRLGVSMIVQEANTLPGLTVAENIFLGMEDPVMNHGIRNTRKMNRLAKEYLQEIGLDTVQPDVDVSYYSMEQRKMIELVKASRCTPKLLMVDETSTALSHDGREQLYKLMQDTKARGDSVLLISHDLQEVLKFCDRIIVMRDGKVVHTRNRGEVDEAGLKTLMVGRELTGKYYRDDFDTKVSDEVVLSVKNLACRERIKNVSFDLHKGEILGIGGLSESGMHELGKAVFGIEYDVTGDITVANGSKVTGVQNAMKQNIGYVSKNRDLESLFNLTDIVDNISITCLDKIGRAGFVKPADMTAFSKKNAELLSIKMSSVNQIVGTLSGGNKQKVALTKWIARGTEIFIMDSPTRGIDVGVKAVIYSLMDDLRKQGKSMIVISEELLELIGTCDRILVLKDGEISGEFMRSRELAEETIVQCMV